jgi:hypothetical protein
VRQDNQLTGERGVYAVGAAVLKLGWFFHKKSSPEFGIDGEIEMAEQGELNAKLLKVQIKSGPSWFRSANAKEIPFRPSKKHVKYWLANLLPVLIMLHEPESNEIYWQEISRSKLIPTKLGWKINVPRSQVLSEECKAALTKIAEKAHRTHPSGMWSRHASLLFLKCLYIS